MKTRAAVAFAAKQPLEIVELDLAGPKEGEVLVEIMATGICHTDAYTLDGFDSEGIFPSILGHEGAGIVREVGAGVNIAQAGRPRHPALHARVPRVQKLHLAARPTCAPSIRATQGKGVMPDGTSRFSYKGETIYHYMGCSTFSNFTVLPEIALAKIREDAPFDKVCYIGCGVTTGVGAVINTAKVEPGANVVVFGLGGIGLNVIQGARMVGADKIIGVDINDDKKSWGERFGMTDFVNPDESRGRSRRASRRAHRRRRRLHLRLHRQYGCDAHGARVPATAAGGSRSSSASPRPARRSPPARSSWSPAGSGKAPPSAAPRAAPTCRRSSTGTWTERSRSTR